MAQIKTFLGANTPSGFCSLFSEIYNPYKDGKAYIIKGGPGTGKSSFMKKVAEAANEKGYDTELVYCSSDPDSLDGVIVPELSFCMVDGTAPHVVEPQFPGACENIINMGAFWDIDKIYEKRNDIRSLTIENSLYHRRSSRFLASAGAINEDTQKLLAPHINEDKISSFANRFINRETPKKKNSAPGKKIRRYISAITPKGVVFLDDTVTSLASRVIGIKDEYAAVSCLIIEKIGEAAVRNGYDVIFCPCPMKKSVCEHIIIPEASLAVISVKSEHPTEISFDRLIHAQRFIDQSAIKEQRNRLAFNKKLTSELVSESVSFLKKAKEIHDRLETCYVDSMDFSKADEFEAEFIAKVILHK